jgi:type IV secretion system protein VirB5
MAGGISFQAKERPMMLQRLPTTLVSASFLVIVLLASPTEAEIVFDPNVFARQFEQLTELKKQVDTLTSPLKVAQDQLNQAKQLYDSFNKLTNANDIGTLLSTPQFRKVLPQQFSDIEKLVAGQGSGNFASSINQYLSQNRAYAGNSANSYYQSELDRIARQTGAKHSMGQAVYDTASQRIDALEELRTRISSATDVKEILDLSARLQAEQALLQNDVLRMQGLAMIQQARADMDGQREREKQRQLVDEIKAALQ